MFWTNLDFASELQIQDQFKVEWDNFTMGLKHCVFRMSRESDSFFWSWNESFCHITTKNAYEALCFSSLEMNTKWWYKSIWKWNAPLKIKLFAWLL